ncbi:MAG: hypothetical protein ACI9TY_001065 [Alphaproteobacteria bacterium]
MPDEWTYIDCDMAVSTTTDNALMPYLKNPKHSRPQVPVVDIDAFHRDVMTHLSKYDSFNTLIANMKDNGLNVKLDMRLDQRMETAALHRSIGLWHPHLIISLKAV